MEFGDLRLLYSDKTRVLGPCRLLLLPVHLDPQFAMMYVGALAFQRAVQKRPEILSRLFPAITASAYEAVGPCTRMYELLETPPVRCAALDEASCIGTGACFT